MTLCLLAQPKEGQQQFKNKTQPQLTENQTVWKSDNQGIKEETFIQTCRRSRNGQRCREDSEKGGSLQTGEYHIHVQINGEEQLGNKTDHTTQGSSTGK